MIACPRCSTENTEDSRYCKWCGKSLELSPPVVQRQVRARGLGLFAILIMALLLLCCVVTAAALATSRRPPAFLRLGVHSGQWTVDSGDGPLAVDSTHPSAVHCPLCAVHLDSHMARSDAVRGGHVTVARAISA